MLVVTRKVRGLGTVWISTICPTLEDVISHIKEETSLEDVQLTQNNPTKRVWFFNHREYDENIIWSAIWIEVYGNAKESESK